MFYLRLYGVGHLFGRLAIIENDWNPRQAVLHSKVQLIFIASDTKTLHIWLPAADPWPPPREGGSVVRDYSIS